MLFIYSKIILLFILISMSKEDLCPDNQISINPLGTSCINIEDFLENANLTINNVNLKYLASNVQGKIEKNNYTLKIFKLDDKKLQSQNIKKSKIYISEKCMKALEQDDKIKLDTSRGILTIVYNSNNITLNNLPENYFVIRQDNENAQIKYMNSKYFDFSICHEDPILLDNQINITNLKYNLDDETPIDIDKILYAKKFKIDLFDPHSEFLNNICFKFTSEKKTDVTLESRLEYYYQNITLCNESLSSHYISFNYSTKDTEDKILTYRCAYGFYENEEQKLSYIDAIENKMKNIFSVSNIKIIKCYDELFNLRNSVKNYGGAIVFLVFLIQIFLSINFCYKGVKPLRKKIEKLFASAHIKIRLETSIDNNKNYINTNNEGYSEDRFINKNSNENTFNNVKMINSEDQIKKDNITKQQKEKEQIEEEKEKKEKEQIEEEKEKKEKEQNEEKKEENEEGKKPKEEEKELKDREENEPRKLKEIVENEQKEKEQI